MFGCNSSTWNSTLSLKPSPLKLQRPEIFLSLSQVCVVSPTQRDTVTYSFLTDGSRGEKHSFSRRYNSPIPVIPDLALIKHAYALGKVGITSFHETHIGEALWNELLLPFEPGVSKGGTL